ncbi:MAG: ribonuclease HII [Alphaproteobacteria bacterium]|nr:ribonuclease HII [Alphaproteobacteria bacterium]
MVITEPNFSLEIESGHKLVAGVDEAGRGPLCGPVVAGAVIFPNRNIEIPVIIRDSKKMTARQRAIAYEWITQNTIWAVAECSPSEIDELNILWASMLAMERAIKKLKPKPDYILADGNRLPQNLTGQPVVKGDAKSLSIAAASIIAKETRDKIMSNLSTQHPQYGWDKNAGYPTKSHLQAIDLYGINQHYRKSFGPIKERIKNETKNN